MNKADFLEALQKGYVEWEAVLAQVGEARMVEPGVEGEWSVKDVIAHNTWNEQEMVRLLQEHALKPSETDRLWQMPTDERNAEIYEQYRNKPLPAVLAEAKQVHEQLWEAAQTLDDEDLNDPSRFPGMPADWQPWRIIVGCSFTHYPEHIKSIRTWLGK